jgi:hypothetical protein
LFHTKIGYYAEETTHNYQCAKVTKALKNWVYLTQTITKEDKIET